MKRRGTVILVLCLCSVLAHARQKEASLINYGVKSGFSSTLYAVQDLSIAGKRNGLDGARSGLFREAIRIITEVKWLTSPNSDAAEYKAYGNSVAVPCVFFVLAGIVWAQHKEVKS